MKLNNKGFVISTLMYALLIVFLFLIIGIITLLSNRKMILDKLKKDVKDEANGMVKYKYYPDGTAIYYNPVTNKICTDYEEDNSLNETKTGCLKWYTFNDSVNSNKVNMILDHNTTYKVAYNSTESNSEPKEVQEELDNLVDESKWKVTPRLILADEIAHIAGADRDDTLKWSSKKENGESIETQSSWFYLDGSGNTYTGWKTQVANSSNKSKYAWLYEYTNNCEQLGCNHSDNTNSGYWTNTAMSWNNNQVWHIMNNGHLGYNPATFAYIGVRPVITIDKKILSTSFSESFEYTGDVQTFMPPVPGNYKIELWGAQGGKANDTYIGGNGGYSVGNIKLEADDKLSVFVGGKGNNTDTNVRTIGGFNGGGSAIGGTDGRHFVGSGGGATDVRNNSHYYEYTNIRNNGTVYYGPYWKTGKGHYQIELYGSNLTKCTYSTYDNATNNGDKINYTIYSKMGDDNHLTLYVNVDKDANIAGLELRVDTMSLCTINKELFTKLEDRVIVAGGGGGAYYHSGGYFGNGGFGGGLTGGTGESNNKNGTSGATGATQTSGGLGIGSSFYGIGGSYAAGGGGGYYGGGATTGDAVTYGLSGAGGGSGYIEGVDNGNTIAGNASMPTHDGKSTMTGNTGNGYAKITYLGK